MSAARRRMLAVLVAITLGVPFSAWVWDRNTDPGLWHKTNTQPGGKP